MAISFLPREKSDALVTQRAVQATGRRCVLLRGDVTSRRYCDQAVKRTVKELGRLDILVSNAAHQTRKKSLSAVSDQEFDRTFKTNVYAYFWLARAALKHMKPGAVILATSSETGTFGSPQLPDYSATKGAIEVVGPGSARSRDTRQCSCPRPGMDTVESLRSRSSAQENRCVWHQESYGPTRSARRGSPGVCVPGL